VPRAGLDTGAVVRSAAALADAEGLRAVTLARLAGELGVRPPSLYAHVRSLEDLRGHLAELGASGLADELQRAAAGRSGPDALAAVAGAYRAYARAHPGLYAAAQRPSGGETTQARERALEIVLAVLRGFGLNGDEAVHAARAVRSALHGFVTLEASEGFGYPLAPDESFARLVAILAAGLGPGSQPRA
jgi:AcrR family transcriptional regulator